MKAPSSFISWSRLPVFLTIRVKHRLDYVKRFYDAVSTFKISLPTPIMSGVRTPTRQFSSCVLIECGDSLDSINATSSAIVKYVSQRAGIGINAGRIRALGSPIRGGEAFHTGCIPFLQALPDGGEILLSGWAYAAVQQRCSIRLWHLEVESLLVLKNNRGVEGNRVRHMDYGVQINKLDVHPPAEGWRYYAVQPVRRPGAVRCIFRRPGRI
ncbi:Ribonucleotide reductase of class Ia (aerobic)alpha subunit [Salmonella bongori]|nr:Ribonucleotide reductase of class Ia (aerobic)alpha subunit [Salmonella bongori]